MNIYEAIPKVMAEVGAVAKDDKNPQQGYKYRGIDAVMNALHPALSKYKIFVAPEILEHTREERTTSKGGLLIYSVCRIRYTFYAEDGSSVSATVTGEGMDSGDKSTNKAMSAAFKYACFQTFCIPTEEMIDSEKDSPEPEPKKKTEKDPVPQQAQIEKQTIMPAKIKALKARLASEKIPEQWIFENYKVNSLEELTEKKFKNIIDNLEKIKEIVNAN